MNDKCFNNYLCFYGHSYPDYFMHNIKALDILRTTMIALWCRHSIIIDNFLMPETQQPITVIV